MKTIAKKLLVSITIISLLGFLMGLESMIENEDLICIIVWGSICTLLLILSYFTKALDAFDV